MAFIGAQITLVEPGHVIIELPFRDDLTQQHGFIHGGITSTIADSAGGYAAYSLFAANEVVLTVEFKINLLAPAAGEKLVAPGRVLKPGKTLVLASMDVVAVKGIRRTPVAHGLQTLMRSTERAGLAAG
jgi:uncharacterized protein (TIGR00369 family)